MPNGNFAIRPARADELALLPPIEEKAAIRFVEAGLFDAENEVETLTVAFLADRHVWVADQDGVLAGFACAEDIEGFSHLHEIDVLPEHGGRGLGRALMAAVIEDARNRGKLAVTLSTYRDVPWNGPFYASLGFEPVSPVALGQRYQTFRKTETAQGLDISARDLMMLAF